MLSKYDYQQGESRLYRYIGRYCIPKDVCEDMTFVNRF